MSEQVGRCKWCGGPCNPKRGGQPSATHDNTQICISSLKAELAQTQAALERAEGERDRLNAVAIRVVMRGLKYDAEGNAYCANCGTKDLNAHEPECLTVQAYEAIPGKPQSGEAQIAASTGQGSEQEGKEEV